MFDREDDATEEEVMALFEERDGKAETEEEENEEAPEAEEEVEEETEDQDDDEEEPEGDDSTEINLEALDPKVRKFVEKYQAEAKKWQENHGKIQSQWTKASQSQKEFESTRERLEQRDALLNKFEELLENNPKLVEMIQKETARTRDPLGGGDDVPDYLKEDPAYKFLESRYKPLIQKLETELKEVKQKTSRFDEMDRKEAEAKNRQHLDTQLGSAREQIKSIFGRDATEDEVTEVLAYMVENKFYGNGKAAALAVYGDKYEQAIRTKQQTEMKEKAKKFPARNKSVPSSRAVSSSNTDNPHEAIAKALAEQGY